MFCNSNQNKLASAFPILTPSIMFLTTGANILVKGTVNRLKIHRTNHLRTDRVERAVLNCVTKFAKVLQRKSGYMDTMDAARSFPSFCKGSVVF